MTTQILKTLDFGNAHQNQLFLNLLEILKNKHNSDLSIISPLDIKNTNKLTKDDIFNKLKHIKLVKITIPVTYLLNINRIIIKHKLLFIGMSLFYYLPTKNIRTGYNYKSLGDNFTIITNESNLLYFKKYATSTTSISDSLGDNFKQLLNETNDLVYMKTYQVQ